jgi:hypothetical protein
MNFRTKLYVAATAAIVALLVFAPEALSAETKMLAPLVLGAGMLDVFNDDAFSFTTLTDAINEMPFIPGRAGAVAGWQEQGVATLTIAIEKKGNVLEILNPSGRGGPGQSFAKVKANLRDLRIPHYQIDDAIYADEVQGVREFGSESNLKTVQGEVNRRMEEHVQLRMDPTIEHQRLGAIKGIIVDGAGNTVYNLYTEFGVTQQTEVDFNLDSTANDGSLRKECDSTVRKIAKALGGVPYRGVYGFCSDAFWDALIKNAEVRSTYLQQQEASQLRTGTAYQTFNFGGITWENYRGGTGTEEATPFIATDKCHIFPVGVPNLFRTYYAPADYEETVNTIGLPRYARQFPMQNGKGRHMELQSNALSICTRPRVLIQGKTT